MNIDDFAALFDFDSAANIRALESLRTFSGVENKTPDIFAHLLSAKQVWMFRLRGEARAEQKIWPHLDLDASEALIEKNRRDYREYFLANKKADLSAAIRYNNSRGIEYENSVQEILLHILIHSGYHRGQIAMAVRNAGGEPVNTDYIYFVREKKAPDK